MIAPGKSFVIVENTASKRKTHTTVSFNNNERFYEHNAIAKRIKFPQNTFIFIQKYLGAMEQDKEVFEIKKKYFEDYLAVMDPERKTFKFQLQNFKFEEDEDNLILSIEEITAMIIKNAKIFAERQGNIQIKDCVITIPSHWKMNQRLVISQAIQIAGLNILSFIHENTAAALYYGLDRNDANQSHLALFINIGSYNTQASLVEFTTVNSTLKSQKKPIESINVLADQGLSDVGGLAFDHIIATHFAEEYDNLPNRKGQESIKNNKRAMMKLLKESQTLKETLSANKEAYFSIEGLSEGVDFKSKITRQVFEEKSAQLIDRILIPIQQVLKLANKSIEEIDQIELLGGGVRIPKVQQQLQKFFVGKDVGQHLNGDESMALGSSFFAANLSHSFKVRDIQLNDGYSYEVNVVMKNLDENITDSDPNYYYKNFTLFSRKKKFGSRKTITFNQLTDVQLELKLKYDYTDEEVVFSRYALNDISKISSNKHYNESMPPKVHLEFYIDAVEGIVLEEAYCKLNYTEEEEYWEKIREVRKPTFHIANETNSTNNSSNSTDSSNTSNDTSSSKSDGEKQNKTESTEEEQKEQQQQQKQDDEENDNNKEKGNKNKRNQGEDENTKQDGEDDSIPEYKMKFNRTEKTQNKTKSTLRSKNSTKGNRTDEVLKTRIVKKTKQVDLNILEELVGIRLLNKTDIKNSIKKLKKFEDFEETNRKRAEIKNKIEAFVYQTKEWSEQEFFLKTSTQEERDKLKTEAELAEDWVYTDEAKEANLTILNEKYKVLTNLIEPISKRIEQHRQRPLAVNKTIKALIEFGQKLDKLSKTMSWVSDRQKEPAYALLNSTMTWFQEKLDQQQKSELFEDPVFVIEALPPMLEAIKKEYTKLKNIKKPKTEKSSSNSSTGNKTKEEIPNILVDGEEIDIDVLNEKIKETKSQNKKSNKTTANEDSKQQERDEGLEDL